MLTSARKQTESFVEFTLARLENIIYNETL